MARLLSTLALGVFLLVPAIGRTADDGPIVINGTCTTDQHLNLDGDCVCNNSTHVMVDFECVPDPSKFFGQLTDIVVDLCEFVGQCGGGGGSGDGGGDPTPEPQAEEDECLFEDGDGEPQTCGDRWNECASEGLRASNSCPQQQAESFCLGSPRQMEFPDGSAPFCRVATKTGALICTFSDPFTNRPFVGDLGELFVRCLDAWIESGELADEIQDCRDDAIDKMVDCQDQVVTDCEEAGCDDFLDTPSLLQSQAPGAAAPPTHEVFLRTRVRTRGESAEGADSLARRAAKSTCYWHLVSAGTLPPDATLFCKGGEGWETVGSSRFLLADGGDYVADGACGIATAGGLATGRATFRWKLERDNEGAFLRARVKSIAGQVEGSLDGGDLYYGDCKVTGKAIEERDVPSGLRELVRER